MRLFDQKFGAQFLAGVPSQPGVYRLYDEAGALLYVGKARDLRRRLAQYRTTRRTKKDRKRRRLVRSAARIVWEVCESELDAALDEIRLIQALRPRENVAGAFSFLYPFIGIRLDGRETNFCLTTSPEAFPSFDLYGAFRSREVTGEAFFSLMRLLRFIGHPTFPRRRMRSRIAPHSYVGGIPSSAGVMACSVEPCAARGLPRGARATLADPPRARGGLRPERRNPGRLAGRRALFRRGGIGPGRGDRRGGLLALSRAPAGARFTLPSSSEPVVHTASNFWNVWQSAGTCPRLTENVQVTSLTYTAPRESTARPCGAAKLPGAQASALPQRARTRPSLS